MIPVRGENEVVRCPFGANFTPAIVNCLGFRCMAWDVVPETKELPVGIDPGPGWEKDGPDVGIGGAVTHRQKWKREAGRCGRVLNGGR